MLGCRDEHTIDLLHRQQFFKMLHSTGGPAVIVRVCGGGLLAVHLPEVADRNHLDVVTVLQLGRDQVEISTAASDANVTEGNTVIRPSDFSVRQSSAGQD